MMRILSSAISAALVFSARSNAVAAQPNSCVRVIEKWRDAVDCQVSELIEPLTWSDGFTSWPTLPRQKWSEIQMTGGCPKYSTTLREWQVAPVRGNRQIVSVKEITRRVDFDGQYTGDYSVNKVTYTCERRGGQWRIFSQDVTRRDDFVNKAVERKYNAMRSRK
jgi:hypothetical protein